tara:strand:- start:3872 stop:5059 length:1188 start_codon:yes stop_codon:yes gene_type:complete
MEIYDIIHGNIVIEGLAQKIIDTEEFQRLRNIKQLGCCNFVFPGAVHTRFEHSIGVYHLSKKYIDILNKEKEYFTPREKECISVAGLIHDIGHGPYSHLFDELFSKDKNHEYRSGELFKRMNEKYKLGFNPSEIQNMIHFIYPKNVLINAEEKYKYQIISNNNGIDVDRFDYLMRDIKMTGLNYGIEYERIMNHSRIENNEIIYSEKVKTNIDEFFRIRFIMYKEVYNHRTVRGIEFMMKDFIKIFSGLHSIDDVIQKDQWDKFIQLNDSIIYQHNLNQGLQSDEVKMNEIIHNIMTRSIYKSVGEILLITDTDIDFDHDEKKVIIDKVIISYNDYEKCNYYQEKNIINTVEDKEEEKLCIIRVYSKDDKSKQRAIESFNLLHSYLLHHQKSHLQ